MSDDLVKRLRYVAGRVSDMDDHIDVHLGADRIEELEERLATCEKYRDAYAECDRIAPEVVRDLEARLEKAMGALDDLISTYVWVREDEYERGWSEMSNAVHEATFVQMELKGEPK